MHTGGAQQQQAQHHTPERPCAALRRLVRSNAGAAVAGLTGSSALHLQDAGGKQLLADT